MKLAILATKSSTPKHFYPGCNIREGWDRYFWSKPCGEREYLRTQKCLNQKKRVLYLGHCGLSDYLPTSNTVMITCISNFLANIKLMYRKQPQKILCFWNLFKSCLFIHCLMLIPLRGSVGGAKYNLLAIRVFVWYLTPPNLAFLYHCAC